MGDSDAFADFAKSFGPEVLSYLERRRKDRREVFDLAFEATDDPGAKIDLAIAFLQSTNDLGVQDVVAAATKKVADAASPAGRYLDARINASDFGANILRLSPSGLLESTFPTSGAEHWTQVSITLDERLRRLNRKQDGALHVVVMLNEREILFSERVSSIADGVPMVLPKACLVNYADPWFAIRIDGLKETSDEFVGMIFRFGVKTTEGAA